MKKNPNYFRQGQPYLDELYFLPTPDENQKVVLLQTGQVDFADTVPLPRVKELQQAGKIVVSVPGNGLAGDWMVKRHGLRNGRRWPQGGAMRAEFCKLRTPKRSTHPSVA